MHKVLDKWANVAPFLHCEPQQQGNSCLHWRWCFLWKEYQMKLELCWDVILLLTMRMTGACMCLDPYDLASELISFSTAHAPQPHISPSRCSRWANQKLPVTQGSRVTLLMNMIPGYRGKTRIQRPSECFGVFQLNPPSCTDEPTNNLPVDTESLDMDKYDGFHW